MDPIRPYIDEALDTVDAAIFSGDAFMEPANRANLRAWMERWERELKLLDKVED